MRLKSIFWVIACLAVPSVQAEIRITEILNPHEAAFHFDQEVLEVGDRLPARSKTLGEILGFVDVTELHAHTGKGKVILHSENALILAGDTLQKISYAEGNPEGFPGRGELQIQGHKKYSARFKPIIDQGLLGTTAQTLDKGEVLLNIIGNFSWGITDNLTVSTIALADALGYPNLGAKFRLIDNEIITISPEASALFYPSLSGWAAQGIIHVRMPSNSKFVSHYTASISTSNNAGSFSNLNYTTSFQSGYEYIRDNWDRILIGPKYNFGTSAFGGYLAYMWIWNHFHLEGGIQTANVIAFRFGTDAYLPYINLYWRF